MAGEGRDGMEELIPENSTLAQAHRRRLQGDAEPRRHSLRRWRSPWPPPATSPPHWSARERGSVPACGAASAARCWRTSTPTW
ncbi:MAG: hypothetical protein ACLU38_00625 [Dysosmobacter sp.]